MSNLTVCDCLLAYKNARGTQGSDSRFEALYLEFSYGTLASKSRSFLTTLAQGWKRKDNSPATINRKISLVKSAIKFCYESREGKDYERMIDHNYLEDFPLLPENNINYCILNPEEKDAVYSELAPYLKPLFYQACYYPCRKEELLSLTKKQVDLSRKKIWIAEDKAKNGKGRLLPIPDEMMQWYSDRMRDLDTDYIFANGRKRIVDFKNAWNGALSRAAKKVGSDKILGYNWHKTRQQAAMELLYQGWDSMLIMHVGGWLTSSAFHRYVNVNDVLLDIKQGLYTPDFSWKDRYPREFV